MPTKVKVWAWGDELKPHVAILDPELTVGVPAHITAATGLDALVHAIEAATNKHRTDGNDLYALKAISLISENLERAIKNPNDLEARGACCWAPAMAALPLIIAARPWPTIFPTPWPIWRPSPMAGLRALPCWPP